MNKRTFQTALGSKTLTAEFNDLAAQANGSVLLRLGETVVLVTVVMSEKTTSLPYFPLSVEFEEKFYAAGAILGSPFVRREGRPSDEAVLSARMVDRTIRPLFPTGLRNEVQVVITVLAVGEDDPDTLGILGASLALSVSDIPWHGPVAAVRLSHTSSDKRFTINPTYLERTASINHCEILACGKDGSINMIEAATLEIAETEIIQALEIAQEIHRQLETFQKHIIAEIGATKRDFTPTPTADSVTELFANGFTDSLYQTVFSGTPGKAHIATLKEQWLEACATTFADTSNSVYGEYFDNQVSAVIHRGAVLEGKRPDGRGLDEVRALYAQAGGISPTLHGSGIFYRGETHIFSALTLGGPDTAQSIDTMGERGAKKRFMHHYNFPPFSVGETGRVGGFNRRMIGHGALAEKALLPVIPDVTTFPYTIRLVSETLSSNGSSSMGSVCASTLALMDGGVPITRAVAGIASGLMCHEGTCVVLTDIQGPEDECGDMDFKVAGTTLGVTALQMDVKVAGVPIAVLAEALEKARVARLHVLATMTNTIAAPRATISPRAPEILTLKILPEQIGLVIGSGGKTINKIKQEAGVEEITIEEDGTIFITGTLGTAAVARDHIQMLTRIFQIDEVVSVTISKITPFGAFAKIDNFHEGLIHISEVTPERIETLEGILTVGEALPVVVSKIENGKIGLSIKKYDPDFLKKHPTTYPKGDGRR